MIEEQPDSELPIVNISLIHEIVYSICMALELYGNADYMHEDWTYSVRLYRNRRNAFLRWYEQQRCSPDWTDAGDRIEIFSGPD